MDSIPPDNAKPARVYLSRVGARHRVDLFDLLKERHKERGGTEPPAWLEGLGVTIKTRSRLDVLQTQEAIVAAQGDTKLLEAAMWAFVSTTVVSVDGAENEAGEPLEISGDPLPDTWLDFLAEADLVGWLYLAAMWWQQLDGPTKKRLGCVQP